MRILKTPSLLGKDSLLKTEEELNESLNKYKGVLNSQTLDYLNGLLELEYSVINERISPDDRDVLSELEIYRELAIYNIYHGTIGEMRKSLIPSSLPFVTRGVEESDDRLIIDTPYKHDLVRLFQFYYGECPLGVRNSIPNGYKTMNIGEIELHQAVENSQLRQAELKRVMHELEKLYDAECPYPNTGRIGGPRSDWFFKNSKAISDYEEKFKKLDSKKELTDSEKRLIEVTNKACDILFKYYGLTADSFQDESDMFSVFNYSREDTMHKTRVKKLPNLTIKHRITYL